jgi:hypothetical protein
MIKFFFFNFQKSDLHIFWGANSPLYIILLVMIRVRVMVINATFNNISVISWRSVLLVEETGVNPKKPLNHHNPNPNHNQKNNIQR